MAEAKDQTVNWYMWGGLIYLKWTNVDLRGKVGFIPSESANGRISESSLGIYKGDLPK